MNMDVSKILSRLPEALVDSSRWKHVLDEIKTTASAPHLLIAPRDMSGKLILNDTPWEHDFVSGYDGETGISPYLDYYRGLDRWDKFQQGQRSQDAVLVSQQAGHTLSVTSEFWDWLTPLDVTDNAYIKLFDTDDGWLGLNLHFDHKTGDCAHVLRVLNAIKKPLSTIIKVQDTGTAATQSVDVDMMASPVAKLLLRANGSIHSLNEACETLVNAEPELFKANGSIKFKNPGLQNAFEHGLGAAQTTRLPQIMVAKPEIIGRFLTFVISPIYKSKSAFVAPETLLLVSVLDDVHHAPLIGPFARAHGLTSRQTSVLLEIDKGKSVKQIARDLGLSYEYTRSILYKQIFPVLGVSELPELVALLGRIHRIAV